MPTDLSTYSNESYQPGSLAKRLIWYLANRLFINTSIMYPMFFKVWLLKSFGAKIGKGINIKPKVNIKYPWFLQIGDHVWIGEEVWIDNLAMVSIGSHVCISQGAMLLTGNHNYKKESFDLMPGPITLEDGVWIGAKAVVCPQLICKSHAVLAVGSVAHSDLDAYTIYQGNPAKAIRIRNISE
jgi:putative colanic acid biosynthesis acetyltransferase WcaF